MTDAPTSAPDHIRAAALAEFRDVTPTRLFGCIALLVAGVTIFVGVGRFAAPGVGSGLVAGGVVWGFATFRAVAARRAIEKVPGVPVHYVGWYQPKGGYYFGLFRPGDPEGPPFAVLKAPMKNRVASGAGWLFDPRTTTTAALVTDDGTVLCTGGMIDDGRHLWSGRPSGVEHRVGGDGPSTSTGWR